MSDTININGVSPHCFISETKAHHPPVHRDKTRNIQQYSPPFRGRATKILFVDNFHAPSLAPYSMTSQKTSSRFTSHAIRFALWSAFITAALCLPGCQKRCESLSIGPIELGMSEHYTPGPVSLLDETIFKYKGPDYPQMAIPVRIEKALARDFPIGSAASPLITALQSQHFACEKSAQGHRCHLTVTVERQERCSLLDGTHHYTYAESVDISTKEEAEKITHINATYDTQNITNNINQREQK